jgi:hypothetical protein
MLLVWWLMQQTTVHVRIGGVTTIRLAVAQKGVEYGVNPIESPTARADSCFGYCSSSHLSRWYL